MIDRLADMKSMVLKMSSRIKGDEFTIGIIEHLEKCNTLICNEHETGENKYRGDDLVVLEKNLNELIGRLSKMQNDMHHYSELISLLQIKYLLPDRFVALHILLNIFVSLEKSPLQLLSQLSYYFGLIIH